MKRNASIILMILLVSMSFAACSTESPASTSIQQGSEQVPIEVPNEPNVEAVLSHRTMTYKSILYGDGNDDGYYKVEYRPNGIANLTYIDYDALTQTVLCTRPDCAHDMEGCVGFISCEANVPLPLAWGNHLILVYPGNPFYPELGAAVLPRIDIADADGSNPKTLHTFAATQQINTQFALDDSSLYYCLSDVTSLENMTVSASKAFEKISLETGETQTLYTYKNSYDYVGIIGAAGDELIGITLAYPQGAQSSMVGDPAYRPECTLFGIHRNTQQHTVYKTWTQGDIAGRVADDSYLYLDAFGQIMRFDFGTQTEHVVLAEFDATVEEINFEQFHGSHLYIIVAKVLWNADKTTSVGFEEHRYLLDIESGACTELQLSMWHHGMERPILIIAITQNDLLVISKATTETATLYEEEQAYTVNLERLEYSLISHEAFLNSEEAYRTIDRDI